MIRIYLNEEEKKFNSIKTKSKIQYKERAYYVLLCGEGHSVSEMAKLTGRNEHTIGLWIKRHITYGVTGLKRLI
ncbi:helix-turn-helix domain-containing protein [Fluoribacter gormanii]|uniref:helix-turn-helix domain-containing protein n=1 Tax=Fluoribacter gormanii TaxID=464 RepID=UPI00104104CB|nr:helix-turn-helix domain-containing protein [Fluoribacter gormanii]